MNRNSKSKKGATILGVGLLMLTACMPDAPTRGGAAQPAPIERSTDDGAVLDAASNANETNAPAAAPRLGSQAQPAATSASRSTLASPLPTPTVQPTPRPQGEIEFTGTVEVIASDMWVVGGRTVAVTAATEIKPGLTIGALAKVHAVTQADGTLWAREIEPAGADDHGNGNSNSNDNGNSNDDHGNGNVNSNDDNGNDDHGNMNSNDDNGNDDHGGNGNDDHGGNSNDDHDGNGNDDHGGNGNDDNGNDDHGGNGNDDHGGNGNGG